MSVEFAPEPWSVRFSAAGVRNPWLILIVLSLATFMEVLDTSVANISLRHIGGDLSVCFNAATWTLSSYLVANAVIVPLSGWLSDVLGRKRYYMISVAVFTLGSLACALAPSLFWLVIARIIQGLGGGGLAPCEQSMLVDSFPPERRGRAVAAYGVVLVFGPAFGPTIGGLITDAASWRWIFLINIPVGILSLCLVHWLVTEPAALSVRRAQRLQAPGGIDVPGFVLIALGLASLQLVLDRGQDEDWFASVGICLLALVAAFSLTALCVRELTCTSPVLDLRLFKHRGFALASLIMAVTGATLYATTQMVPQFLQQVMGYTARYAGLAMTVSSLATLTVTGLTAFLCNRVPAWQLIMTGVIVEVAGLIHTTLISDHMGFWTMASDRVWLVAGLPLILAPLTTGAYVKLSASHTGQASAFLNLFRNIGGAAGISAAQTLLARRASFHYVRLSEDIAVHPLSGLLQLPSEEFQRLYQDGNYTDAQGLALIVAVAKRQGLLLSYIDVFWAFALVMTCLLPVVILIRCPDTSPNPLSLAKKVSR